MKRVAEITIDIYELQDGSLVASASGPDAQNSELNVTFHRKTDNPIHDAWCDEKSRCLGKEIDVNVVDSRV